MNKYIVLCFLVLISIGSNAQKLKVGKLLNKAKSEVLGVTEDNTSLGLKEALNEGVSQAVSQLSTDGGYLNSAYKILLPEEATKVINTVKRVPGFGDVEEKLISKMNQAAELAAKKATPIFVAAIKNMTLKDARAILFGENNAATSYLSNSSRKTLYAEFMPIIQASLDEVNARSYWKTAVDAYNKIPLKKKLNPELDDHVNQKGLDGLFSLIEKKEEGIRGDVGQRTSPLLKEVFGQLD